MQYSTILADPPWDYDHGQGALGTRPRPGKNFGGVDRQYQTMKVPDIMALPVADLVAPNAHLYLWTTNQFMDEAYDICRAWGFAPKTILTWVKTYDTAGQTSLFGGEVPELRPRVGMGHYFKGATEHILFGVRGSLGLLVDNQVNVFYAPVGRHSEKPEESYRLIERCSTGPFLELFARKKRPGWDRWGNEVESTIAL